MRVLVTGSAGHLGEALMRGLPAHGFEVRGLDVREGAYVDVVGSIEDPAVVASALGGIDGVIHAAALHKPHVATRPKSDFVKTNVAGTLCLLEGAAAAGLLAFVFTSTTSAFGRSLVDPDGRQATWIDESVAARPKNIYGVTKVAAEDLCELVHQEQGLPVVVLRTSRFFPEADDAPDRAAAFDDLNLKVLELLHRRVDLEDLVSAHAAALRRASTIGFGRYLVSAPSPFGRSDLVQLAGNAASVVGRRCDPRTKQVFAELGWRLPAWIDRVYDPSAARLALGWEPRFTFDAAVDRLARGEQPFSDLTAQVGERGYA